MMEEMTDLCADENDPVKRGTQSAGERGQWQELCP